MTAVARALWVGRKHHPAWQPAGQAVPLDGQLGSHMAWQPLGRVLGAPGAVAANAPKAPEGLGSAAALAAASPSAGQPAKKLASWASPRVAFGEQPQPWSGRAWEERG